MTINKEYKIKVYWTGSTADYINEISAVGNLGPKEMRDMFDLLKKKRNCEFDSYELVPKLQIIKRKV